MVRIYCLTSITRISSEENDTIQRRPYKKNAVEEWDIRENVDEQTPKNIKAQEFEFEFYQLTEICIGFDYVKNRKVYAMNIFRKDIGLLVFKMVRGAVSQSKISNNVFDLIIATTKLFPEKINFDLRIRVQCIKNSKIRGIISAEEEAFYEAYAAKLKEFCTKETVEGVYIFPGVREAAFGIFPFDLPNPSKPNVLRQKLSVISRLIFLLCDPETGSYQNVFFEGINKIKEGKSTKNKEKDETLDQKLVCLLYNRNIWQAKKPRKQTLDNQSTNYHGCQSIQWINADLEKFNSNNVNFETLKGVQFYNVHIFDAEEKLHRFFYANTFKALTVVELISCYITKLSDEFFRFIPGTLEHLILKRNDITFISEGIAFFTELRELNLAQNKNLFDDGIPWNCLSWRIETLNLMETNITKIPDEVKRLLSLKKLSASSLQLSYVAWDKIEYQIDEIFINAKQNKLNNFDISDKRRISDLTITNAGLTEIDCVKLQQIFSDLSLGHDEEGEPYRPLHMLELDYNEFETIQWELLPANLHSITLSYNRLKNIGNISHLTKLTMLSISSNQIESISDKIFDLPLLTNLSLDKNNLKELPKNFENFKSLMCLDLSENKFDFYKSNLDEVFWNRLPKNLRTLRISRNKIGILPCILRESKIEELHANECELFHICPYLYLKKVPLKELYISENGNLNNLPFIPQKIFQPPLLKDNDIKEKTKAAFIIITDKSDYIVTKPFPQKLLKPIYEFKILEEVPSFCGCNCCGNCGNKSDENIFIEQLMVMDFGLKMRVMNEEGAFSKINNYSEGKWKTTVRTIICSKCLKILKKKTDAAYEEFKNDNANDSAPLKKSKAAVRIQEIDEIQNQLSSKNDNNMICDENTNTNSSPVFLTRSTDPEHVRNIPDIICTIPGSISHTFLKQDKRTTDYEIIHFPKVLNPTKKKNVIWVTLDNEKLDTTRKPKITQNVQLQESEKIQIQPILKSSFFTGSLGVR